MLVCLYHLQAVECNSVDKLGSRGVWVVQASCLLETPHYFSTGCQSRIKEPGSEEDIARLHGNRFHFVPYVFKALCSSLPPWYGFVNLYLCVWLWFHWCVRVCVRVCARARPGSIIFWGRGSYVSHRSVQQWLSSSVPGCHHSGLRKDILETSSQEWVMILSVFCRNRWSADWVSNSFQFALQYWVAAHVNIYFVSLCV